MVSSNINMVGLSVSNGKATDQENMPRTASLVAVCSEEVALATVNGTDASSYTQLLLTLVVNGKSLETVAPDVLKDARQALIEYVLNGIIKAWQDLRALSKLVQICRDAEGAFAEVHNRVEYECIGSLTQMVQLMLENEVTTSISTPVLRQVLADAKDWLSGRSDFLPGPRETIASSEQELTESKVHIQAHTRLTTLQAISFLHAAVLSDDITRNETCLQTFLLLILLLTSSDSDIAYRSRSAAIAYLYRLSHEQGEFTPHKRSQVIDAIMALSDMPEQETTAFVLWSCLTTSSSFIRQDFLETELYWTKLHHGLCRGSSEQKKYCLAIIQASIDKIEADIQTPYARLRLAEKPLIHAGFAKLAVLFETIVLSRYLNQVHDSLPDLISLAESSSGLGGPWLVALLHAALAHGMQDSIRHVIGTYTIQNGLGVLTNAGQATYDFLEDSFLPWATVASLYQDSLDRSSGDGLVCRHGEGLSAFLHRLILSVDDPVTCIRSMLSFINKEGGRVFSFARAFILDAVQKASKDRGIELDTTCISLLVRIASVQGFQEMVQDLMKLQCMNIAAQASRAALNTCNFIPLQRAAKEVKTRRFGPLTSVEISAALGISSHDDKDIASSQLTDNRTFKSFARLLMDTNCTCLKGTGLFAGIQYLQVALRNPQLNLSKIAHDDVTYCLKAIWDEIEVQEYPRRVMMAVPSVLFNAGTIDLCTTGSELINFLSERLLELQKMSENRAYIFGSLFESLQKPFAERSGARHLPLQQILVRYANHPPSTKFEFELELSISSRLESEIPGRSYRTYYGAEESYGHVCVISIFTNLPNNVHWDEVARGVLDELLQPWLTQRKPFPVSSAWKKTTQLQIMLLCMKRIVTKLDESEAAAYIHKFHTIIGSEPLPRFRYLLEWIVVELLSSFPSLLPNSLERQDQLAQDFANPKLLASTIKINTTIVCLPKTPESYAAEHLAQLVPLSASAKIVIRHEAQWTFPRLWDHIIERGWQTLVKNPAYGRLNAMIRTMPAFKSPPESRIWERFDHTRDDTLRNLFLGEYLKMEPAEAPRTTEENMDLLEPRVVSSDSTQESMASKYIKNTYSTQPELQTQTQQSLSITPLQTKASTWTPDALLTTAHHRPSTTPISLVASFINNPHNLGGLSRISEINNISSLHVRSLSTLSHKDFTSVSVSSHLWLPIHALDPVDVPTFLLVKRRQGYKIVGIEQTDRSVVLDEWEAPGDGRVVLVLGSEREGIPAGVLAFCDECVEIRQAGVTRSMNVQTAAAVVLYEYSRQRQSQGQKGRNEIVEVIL